MTPECIAFLACVAATRLYDPEYIHLATKDPERLVLVLDAPVDDYQLERITACAVEPMECPFHEGAE